MRKLGALYINEMLKNFKKISVFVLIIVMTVGMIGCSSILKMVESIDSSGYISDYDPYEYEKEYAEDLRARISNLEKLIESADESEKNQLTDELINCKYEMVWYDLYVFYAHDNNITNLSYKYDFMEEMYDIKISMYGLELREMTSSDEYKSYEARYNELDRYVKEGDYASYIESENKRISEDTNMSSAQKDAQLFYNNAMLSLNPTGEFESWGYKNSVNSLISTVSTLRSSLENDVDLNSGGNLTPERRSELEKTLAIAELRISDGYVEEDTDNTVYGMAYMLSYSIGSMLSLIIVILLAGSLMSHEMSTGTIKSLIIAPVKRWKIFTAKYFSIITVVVFVSLYTYLVATLVNGLFFGFGSFADKVVYAGGSALKMNYFVYQLISALFDALPLIVIATFAYMLSVVTKNTAASVSVTIGVYLGGNIVHLVLVSALSSYPYIVKFLPFNNLELFERVFYTADGLTGNVGLGAILNMAGGSGDPSVLFSVLYVLVLLTCMIYAGLDHFCRKDIK